MEKTIVSGNHHNLIQCLTCQDFYLKRKTKDNTRFCRCFPLNLKQSKGEANSLIYIAENTAGMIKIGLSRQGKTLKHRFYAINRAMRKAHIPTFTVKHIYVYSSRSLAFSTESVVHYHLRKILNFKTLDLPVNGSTEIYVNLNMKKATQIIENINSFVKKYMPDSAL